jgi:hypothetical protein
MVDVASLSVFVLLYLQENHKACKGFAVSQLQPIMHA